MKGIKLSNSPAHAIVDDEDYSALSDRSWNLTRDGYVRTSIAVNGRATTLYLHRAVARRMGLAIDGKHVDHLDGNPLNNRRSNLRPATAGENQASRWARWRAFGPVKVATYRRRVGGHADFSSGVSGVTWHKKWGRWQATKRVGKKKKWIGLFDTVAEAAEALRRAFPGGK